MTLLTELRDEAKHALRVGFFILVALVALAFPIVLPVITKAAPDWYVWVITVVLFGFAMFKLDAAALQSFVQFGIDKYKQFKAPAQ